VVLDESLLKTQSEFAATIRMIESQVTGSRLLDALYAEVGRLQDFDEDAMQRIEAHRARLSEIHAKTADFVAAAAAHDEEYAEWSVELLERELERVSAEIEELRQRTTDARLVDAGVIGCTVDVFIGRFCDEAMPVDHIFLDEACYTPLIKALTLFRRNIPVTFLGDHKQLPPVCEMDDQTLQQQENQECALWARSAVFAKYLLGDSVPPLQSLLENLEEPPAGQRFPRWTLTRTYRFGQNLAALLDELIYGDIGFTSALEDGSQVEIVVVPSARSDGARCNRNESHAVGDWIQQNGTANVACLAPYKNQVAELRNSLPRELRDDVMTVHGSQGREWDNVILSVTDTMQEPYFTDTGIPIGKLVMNTALSRARKRIVLVCDTHIWSRRRDARRQLISRLILAAAG
jgi:AAA domain